jgi:hypothetical protein
MNAVTMMSPPFLYPLIALPEFIEANGIVGEQFD